MDTKIECTWVENMVFDANLDGHHVIMDASPEVGGEGKGARPKPLLLASLAGCTGIDVVSILKKMRVELEGFRMEVGANLTEEHPKIYDKIMVTYYFKGKDLPMDKLEKAVQLSEEKYCGVSAMLKKAGLIEYEIIIE
ncbi:MAG: OsmC family peroxiredoxin [Tindallia sp. MSAO_Bac2]|nr:MAG: OsmC family peroxiredoxin [Tindallia sp. MSAO_Bac2]